MVRDNFLKLLPYYGHLVNIMFTIGALSQYKMFIIFEGICSIEKLYNIFIPTDARQASVIAGSLPAFKFKLKYPPAVI